VRRLAAWVSIAAAAHLGCWSFVSGPLPREAAQATPVTRPEAILRVNEAGVAWGEGELADAVRAALLRSGRFERVHHPVEPPDPPRLVIEVQALGGADEFALWSAVAALVIGYFYFAPGLVLPFFDRYRVRCEVRVRDGAAVLREFEVESRVTAVHAMLASPEGYLAEARSRLFADLAERIAAGVAAP
jgi:hypothetical protein